jgi:hypothetical protein
MPMRFLHAVLAALFLVVALVPAADARGTRRTSASAPVTTGSLQLFASETVAQAHCPRDEVVWLNTNSGIYHAKGMRWYANTRSGAFVCRKEADAAGDRMTRNGQ